MHASRWPASECRVLVAAIIAGCTDAQLRQLVAELMARRANALTDPIDDPLEPLPAVLARVSAGKSWLYAAIQEGLWTPPVRLGGGQGRKQAA